MKNLRSFAVQRSGGSPRVIDLCLYFTAELSASVDFLISGVLRENVQMKEIALLTVSIALLLAACGQKTKDQIKAYCP